MEILIQVVVTVALIGAFLSIHYVMDKKRTEKENQNTRYYA